VGLLAVTRRLTHPIIREHLVSPSLVDRLVDDRMGYPRLRGIHVSDNALGRFVDVREKAGTSGNCSAAPLKHRTRWAALLCRGQQ